MVVKIPHNFGDVLYVKDDPEQLPRTLVEVRIQPGGGIIYTLSATGDIIEVYDFETSEEKDQLKKLNVD